MTRGHLISPDELVAGLEGFTVLDVRVLDGGWTAWRAAGLPVSHDVAPPAAGDFTVSAGPRLPVVSAADVLDVDVLIDARAPERYPGSWSGWITDPERAVERG